MTKLLLTVIVGAFVAAFAEEVMSREKRGIRARMRANLEDFKSGFREGYRGPTGASSAPGPALIEGFPEPSSGGGVPPLTGQSPAV